MLCNWGSIGWSKFNGVSPMRRPFSAYMKARISTRRANEQCVFPKVAEGGEGDGRGREEGCPGAACFRVRSNHCLRSEAVEAPSVGGDPCRVRPAAEF